LEASTGKERLWNTASPRTLQINVVYLPALLTQVLMRRAGFGSGSEITVFNDIPEASSALHVVCLPALLRQVLEKRAG
jgi:hypothetical protein